MAACRHKFLCVVEPSRQKLRLLTLGLERLFKSRQIKLLLLLDVLPERGPEFLELRHVVWIRGFHVLEFFEKFLDLISKLYAFLDLWFILGPTLWCS